MRRDQAEANRRLLEGLHDLAVRQTSTLEQLWPAPAPRDPSALPAPDPHDPSALPTPGPVCAVAFRSRGPVGAANPRNPSPPNPGDPSALPPPDPWTRRRCHPAIPGYRRCHQLPLPHLHPGGLHGRMEPRPKSGKCGSCLQFGLGCWLVVNQSAVDAAHIKVQHSWSWGKRVSRGAVVRSAGE